MEFEAGQGWGVSSSRRRLPRRSGDSIYPAEGLLRKPWSQERDKRG